MNENWDYLRGDVYLADLGQHYGSEQGGKRPVLLIQNNVGNRFGPTLIVAPITSRFWKKAEQPTHCRLNGLKFLRGPSVVLAEQIITMDWLCSNVIGTIPEYDDLTEEAKKLVLVQGIIKPKEEMIKTPTQVSAARPIVG